LEAVNCNQKRNQNGTGIGGNRGGGGVWEHKRLEKRIKKEVFENTIIIGTLYKVRF
jgi:hypothetical protein